MISMNIGGFTKISSIILFDFAIKIIYSIIKMQEMF